MAINGIGSYYGLNLNSYFDYQNSVNQVRLQKALEKNPQIGKYMNSSNNSYFNSNSELKTSMNFVNEYTSQMSDLMNAANELKSTNKSGVMNDMTVTSSNESVATATEKLTLRDVKSLKLEVTQLAQAQTNVSDAVKATDTASSGMQFALDVGNKLLNVDVSAQKTDGSLKSNKEMIQEAAKQINDGKVGVKAEVVEKDGNISLKLTGEKTGSGNGFAVEGQLGVLSNLDKIETKATNAEYSVTKNGETTQYTSKSNEVSLDFTRIGVTLKGVGETTIRSDVDSNKVASAVEDLVKSYNSSLKLLNDNYDRGSGVDKQLRNLVYGLGSEEALGKLGIKVNDDATLKFDKNTLMDSLKKSPDFTKSLISGYNGIASKAFSKAQDGLNVSSGKLIDNDLGSNSSVNNNKNSWTNGMYKTENSYYSSLFSGGSSYSMSNYYTLGLIMNYFA